MISMGVICTMLVFVTRELEPETRRAILYTTIIIFAFRATPVGRRRLFLVDARRAEIRRGVLRRAAPDRRAARARRAVAVRQAAHRIFRRQDAVLARRSSARCSRCRASGSITDLHEWTERMFGFGARSIAFIDTAAASPFAQLSMIPLLTLIAFYAPAGHRATWFALMASLMNMALVAGQLQTKYLNHVFVVERGALWRTRLAAGRASTDPWLCDPDLRHSAAWAAASEAGSALESARRN